MGPILILDKSVFQSLSHRELLFLRKHFMENLTPILILEILGDLSKEMKGASPDEKVSALAKKFGGSGNPVNDNFRNLLANELLGAPVTMGKGQIVIRDARRVPASAGGYGIIIDLSPYNLAILRWADREFTEEERKFSEYWRLATRSLSAVGFRDQLNKHHVIIPEARSLEEACSVVDDLLGTPSLQDVWFSWLVEQLRPQNELAGAIRRQWENRTANLLQGFAPYSHHCVRAHLLLLVAVRRNLVRWDPTNVLDLQYLYYLPFCMAFVSNDRLHQALAPSLLRDNQTFVVGADLKNDLRRIAEEWERLSDEQRARRAFAVGNYPIPAGGSVACELWKKHCRPWSPGSGNLASNLSAEDKAVAIEEAKALFRSSATPTP